MKIAARFLSIVKCQPFDKLRMTLSPPKGQLLIFTALFSILLTLSSKSPFAAPGESPNPQPCENGLFTDQLTKIVLEPKEYTFVETGKESDEPKHLEYTFTIEVDFSKLSAIFATPNSDYLESKYQSEDHRKENILDLKSSDFNLYHGPGQKAAPKVMTDELRVKYVNYVYDKPELAESANKYTDIEGKGGPKTIYDLGKEFGLPNPPQAGDDKTQWLDTWGRYWEKIPTAVSEFYYGMFSFSLVVGKDGLRQVEQGSCPKSRRVYFVLPEYFRTTSIANQVNQLIVPKQAQSSDAKFVEESLEASANVPKSLLAKIIQTCLKPLLNNPISQTLRKVVKISLNFISPIKNAYAAILPPEGWGEVCPAPIPILPDKKEGSGPFCSFPLINPADPEKKEPQLEAGENCQNVESPNKLDDGTLVKCSFKSQKFVTNLPIKNPGWDKCEQVGTDPDTGEPIYECKLTIRVFPTFYVPWLASIWNNATYSDKDDAIAIFGAGKTGKGGQETGRPGLYTFFKPKSVDYVVFPKNKNLPSKEQGAADEIKQRFLGAVDCNKEFDRDIALKPKALQEGLGRTSQECNLLARADGEVPPGGTDPGPIPTLEECASIPRASDGNPSNGIETSLEELQCYIVHQANGKIEPLTASSLAEVMLNVLAGASGGHPCSFGSAGEVGIFQYIASTWKGVSQYPNSDSGSVYPAPGSSNTCWGSPRGQEPDAVEIPSGANPLDFDWAYQFGANKDGRAWNPYYQIDKTIIKMENGNACEWTTFRDRYGICGG